MQLIGPGGVLREAERMFWADGESTRYAAWLAEATGEAVGGYHGAFRPGVAADVDLYMRLRRAGSRIAYEPNAVAETGAAGDAGPRHAAMGHAPGQAALFARTPEHGRQLLMVDPFVPLRVMGAGYPRAQAIVNKADGLGWAATHYPLDPSAAAWTNVCAEL